VRIRSVKSGAETRAISSRGFGVLVILAAILVSSCASSRTKWDNRIGVYSYQEALLDLGQPAKSEGLSDGTIVADWLTQAAERIETSTLVAAPALPASSHQPYYVEYPRQRKSSTLNVPAQYLRLVFGSNRKLKAWEKMTR
jgi:hypothetical protein